MTKGTKGFISIDIYRILFTTFIMLHHFHMYSEALPFGGGYMATDFFFILSGCLMKRYYDRNKEVSLWKYFERRYVRLFIPLIVANVITFVCAVCLTGYRLKAGVGWFIKENLMLEIFTCDIADRFNPPVWYLGILLMASLIIFLLMIKTMSDNRYKIIGNVICGLLVAAYLILIYISKNGNIYIDAAGVFDVKAFLRGLSGVAAGVLLGSMKPQNIGLVRKALFVLLIPVMMYFLLWRIGYSRLDILVYILIVLAVFVCKDDITGKRNAVTGGISLVAEASYMGYLIHYPIIRILMHFSAFDGMDWKMYSLIYVAIIWVCAMVINVPAKLLLNKVKEYI